MKDVVSDETEKHLVGLFRKRCCSDTCAVCTAFMALARVLLCEGCWVFIKENTDEEFGIFHEEAREIHICRPGTNNVQGTWVELIALAHEAGHWRSYMTGLQSSELNDATHRRRYDPSAFTQHDKDVILTEEELAWTLGEQHLKVVAPGLPLDFWEEFQNFKKERLDGYRTLSTV